MLRRRLINRVPFPALSGKDLSLCFISAILLLLAFPPFNFEWCAWVAFLPFFKALQGKERFEAFLLGYAHGFVFWGGLIYWLVHVTALGTFVLVLYLSCFWGIFGLCVSLFGKRRGGQVIFIPASWVMLEYARSYLFSGFPWALLGYSQYLNIPLIQVADITGSWGVSFLLVMFNFAAYAGWRERPDLIRAAKKTFPAVVILAAVFCYGFYTLHHRPSTVGYRPLKISVIQGNIPQELKWAPGARYEIISRYRELTRLAAESGPALIVWPEAASPVFLGEDTELFKEIFGIARSSGLPLLIGSVVREGDRYFNSALFIDAAGGLSGRYDKLHLVPFGEYIPLRDIFPFLETIAPIGDIEQGKAYTLFSLPVPDSDTAAKFSALICFEDLFPELSRRFVQRGAGFLVNITNDAWYKKSPAAEQHLQASVMRAVENRRYLVRAANTGISGFISPEGRCYALVQDRDKTNIFTTGFSTAAIVSSPADNLTLYTRYGDRFIILCLILSLYGIIRIFKKSKI
ncbi:MAG: apolipoprotein N-acyltransferase [Candidatus Omnitrophica bacterium]|nr:apolipoprotein N-acyltransferase [Candidatus Omnitrophota bacterium]